MRSLLRGVRSAWVRPAPGEGGNSIAARRRSGGLMIAVLLALFLAAGGSSSASARTAPDSFADLAERLLPAVVNISTTQVVEGQTGVEPPVVPPGSPFEEFFKEFFDHNQPRPRQRRATSLGSGFIIDPSGLIVTNNHVIQDAEAITIVLQDDTRLDAKVVGKDPKTDLAVLRVDPGGRKLPFVSFGNSDDVRVGDWVVAIGNPFGFGGTVTAGILSARGRNIEAGPYDDFLQTDAPINRGNSGGPMFNLNGEVIGINTAIYSPSGGSIGIGFAIPSTGAKAVVDQLVAHGEVRRGWLGVRIQQVTDEIAETLGLKTASGALVAGIIDDGPAEKAGLKAGDVILEFDGKEITQMRRLPRVVADAEVGKTVEVRIWRDKKEMTLKVKVAALDEKAEKAAQERTSESGPTEKVQALGVTVAPISDALRERFDLNDDARGLVVTDVDPAGNAAEKGVRPGDLIVEISQQPVKTPADVTARVEEALKTGRKSVLLLVEGQGGLRFVAVKLASKG